MEFLHSDDRHRQWRCSECAGPDYEDQDHLRKDRNCDGREDARPLGMAFDPSVNRCPWKFFDDELFVWLDLWGAWKATRPMSPFGGEPASMPAPTFEMMRFIDSKKREIENGLEARSAAEVTRSVEKMHKKKGVT